MNDSLRLHVQQITTLPTIPVIAQKILATTDDDLASINKLQQIIENDAAISAKVLSVANSSFFGQTEPSRTLNNAIMRIGIDNVRSIALGISLMTFLDTGKHRKTTGYERIFNHSLSVGMVSRILCKYLNLDIAEEVMISGILHDLGFLVLNRFFPDSYLNVMQEFDSGMPLLKAEQSILDFNHEDIGYWLAKQWELPDNVLDSILYHHRPAASVNNLPHVAVTHLADYITTQNILSLTEQNPAYELEINCLDILDISEDTFNEIEAEVKNGAFYNRLFK